MYTCTGRIRAHMPTPPPPTPAAILDRYRLSLSSSARRCCGLVSVEHSRSKLARCDSIAAPRFHGLANTSFERLPALAVIMCIVQPEVFAHTDLVDCYRGHRTSTRFDNNALRLKL